MGAHTRPSFQHLHVAVMYPILQLGRNTRSGSLFFFLGGGEMNFQNPLEKVHQLASPNLTVYNQVAVHFHDTFESADIPSYYAA